MYIVLSRAVTHCLAHGRCTVAFSARGATDAAACTHDSGTCLGVWQTRTRRNAANKTKHNKAECRQTDKPKQTSEHLQCGMPPNKPTKTRRNAANKRKHNKAECRQQDKTQQGGMPPNAFFMCFVAANLRGLATEDCWQGFVSQPPRANPNGSRLPHLP